jgi:hypothetical protein
LQSTGLPDAAQAALELQRAKLAGSIVPADLSPEQQALATEAIKSAFISGYRWAMGVAGGMAWFSAIVALRFIRGGRPQGAQAAMP